MSCGRTIGPFACCSVIKGDCLEYLKLLPDGCVDAVITDPPYGIGIDTRYASNKRGGKDYPLIHGDDKPFNPGHLLRFDNLLMWGANHYASRLPDSQSWLVWDKRCRTKTTDQADCEFAWMRHGGPARVFYHVWDGFNRDSERGLERVHPTQKPIALMQWCIEQFPYYDVPQTILDPYCGSGTTLVAAKKLGRHYLGFEISREYCEIAQRRLEAVDAQPSLFASMPEQMELVEAK